MSLGNCSQVSQRPAFNLFKKKKKKDSITHDATGVWNSSKCTEL